MIFIGAELNNPNAHFVTNIIACIGSGNDLVIDLLSINDSDEIFRRIAVHLQNADERYVVYNAYTNEDFFLRFKSRFPRLHLLIIFSDDEWRHSNYNRYLALYADLFTTAVKGHLALYEGYGLIPTYMPWACNPKMYYPVEADKDIDVSFVGTAYGKRLEYIRSLISSGIEVRVYGRGWGESADLRPHWGGALSHQGVLEVISRSKINLNFLWTSAKEDLCTIKARTLELSACDAFQLSNYTFEFDNYGLVEGQNIATFDTKEMLLSRVRYYLKHEDEREQMARNAYELVLQQHTWEQRFQTVFERLEKKPNRVAAKLKKYDLMIFVREGVRHDISVDDTRMNIQICQPSDTGMDFDAQVDGVVWLDHDSGINNEALYIMAFGLSSDESDAIASNFYISSGRARYWIRFRDRMLNQNRKLLSGLPGECIMYSGGYASTRRFDSNALADAKHLSYIEFPSYQIDLPYAKSRRMRLYYADYGDSRVQLKKELKALGFGRALSLMIDKAWQKLGLGQGG